MKNRKDAVDEALEIYSKTMTEEQKQCLEELTKAVVNYNHEKRREYYSELHYSFIIAAKKGIYAFSLIENMSDDKVRPFFSSKDNGSWYVLLTSPEEVAFCPVETCILIQIDSIISAAISDQEHEGICLNPYGRHPFYLPRESLMRLRTIADMEE